MQQRIDPFRHGADQTDQRLRIQRCQLFAPCGASQRVVTTPFPEFNPVGKLGLQPHLVAGPEHELAGIEVESLDGEQQQIQTFHTTSAEAGTLGGRGISHGCDDARGHASASSSFGP